MTHFEEIHSSIKTAIYDYMEDISDSGFKPDKLLDLAINAEITNATKLRLEFEKMGQCPNPSDNFKAYDEWRSEEKLIFVRLARIQGRLDIILDTPEASNKIYI